MQFQENLKQEKQLSQDSEPEKMVEVQTIKMEINDLLFRYMPPKTTISDVDDFAMAILRTIKSAWETHDAHR